MLPFAEKVRPVKLDPHARLAVNAAKLAAMGGGGTAASAPLALLNRERAAVDLVVIVSDNQSWVDARWGATDTMREWDRVVRRNPAAKLVCVDIQPHGTTQASGRPEILNVGGFSDAVFDTIARFAMGETRDWVSIVNETEV